MTRLEKAMDEYYSTLITHKTRLDYTYNVLVEIWEKSKLPKIIHLVDEKEYHNGVPVIFNNDKFYPVSISLKKDQAIIHLINHQTDTFTVDEIQWYGNHELKTLVIEKIASHLGYSFEIGSEIKKETKKKKK